MVISPGKTAARMGDAAVPLGRRASVVGGRVVAPLQPIAEAFGAKVHFDPLTRRTYLTTAGARAAVKPLQWPTRRLTEAQLRGKSAAELRMMRNIIQARRGRQFENGWLRHYFYCLPWYNPDRRYGDALLTDVDRANMALIGKIESARAR